MKQIRIDELYGICLNLVMIEAYPDNSYSVTISTQEELYVLYDLDGLLFRRFNIDDITDELSAFAIGDLFLHVNPGAMPPNLESTHLSDGGFSDYIHLAQDVVLKPQQFH